MIYPMFAIVLLIFCVGVLNLYWRVTSVMKRKVRARYYKVFHSNGAEIPERILAGSRNFANLFEVPLLFLITCTVIIAMDMQSPTFVALAWLFVVSRVVHSVIHMSYNHILHRMLVFNLGFFSVLAMWVMLILRIQ